MWNFRPLPEKDLQIKEFFAAQHKLYAAAPEIPQESGGLAANPAILSLNYMPLAQGELDFIHGDIHTRDEISAAAHHKKQHEHQNHEAR